MSVVTSPGAQRNGQRQPDRRPGFTVGRIMSFPVYLSGSWVLLALLDHIEEVAQSEADDQVGELAGNDGSDLEE